MLGRAAAEMLGRPCFDTFPGLRGTAVEETLRRGRSTTAGRGSSSTCTSRWDHWFEMRAYPDSRGLTVIVRDIDERLPRRTAAGRRDARS